MKFLEIFRNFCSRECDSLNCHSDTSWLGSWVREGLCGWDVGLILIGVPLLGKSVLWGIPSNTNTFELLALF